MGCRPTTSSAGPTAPSRLAAVSRRLGFDRTDSPAGLVRFAAFFAGYAVIDVVTRALARPDAELAQQRSLVVSAVAANPEAMVAAGLVVGLALWRSPSRWLGHWSTLERGRELRLLALPLLFLLTWQEALQPYNFLLDRTNLVDRGLLVVLAVGAAVRPGLLLAFVAQHRILAEQYAFPFGSVPGQNIDELLVIVLAALAGAHLVVTVTRSDDTSPVLAVLAAAVATHFFVPGRGKLIANWLFEEDLANLPPNAYTAGWLGQTDGATADRLGSVVRTIGWPARLATMVLELGAAVVAIHHRWFRWWLFPAAIFHVVNFVMLGYWFLGWVVLEFGLFLLISRDRDAEWSGRNLSLGRAAVTFFAVAIAGPVLFHPPGLAWFDSPVAEGYRLEAAVESGANYHVPFEVLAPFEQDLAFGFLVLGETTAAIGAYGVVATPDDLERYAGLTGPSHVTRLRRPLSHDDEAARDQAEAFLAEWIDRANRRAAGQGPWIDRLWTLAAPSKFWTGRPEPVYQFQEPVGQLQVDRVTSLTTDEGTRRMLETVLVMEVGPDGTVTVIDR